MFQLKVDSSDLRGLIDRYQSSLNDLRPFLAGDATDIVYREIRRAFETEGYGTWPPLSPAYARWKARVRPGKGMLRFNDAYYRAATTPRSRGSRYQVTNKSLRIGVREEQFPGRYPLVHELGSSRVPARPVFGLVGDRIREPIGEAFRDYLVRTTRRRGRR